MSTVTRGATTRTLLRGLMLLEMIGNAADGATLPELAASTELDRRTVTRLLDTLLDSGWTYWSSEDRTYRLAGKALALSHDESNRVDLRALATSHLSQLCDLWHETVCLGAVDGNDVVCLERVLPNREVRVVSTPGQRMPITRTALGKAYLAALPAEEAEWLARELSDVGRAARTAPDTSAFRQDLARTVERGYAVDLAEADPDITCVGSAVTDVTGRPVAMIGVSAPTYRMRGQIDRVGQSCALAATSISVTLGDAGRID